MKTDIWNQQILSCHLHHVDDLLQEPPRNTEIADEEEDTDTTEVRHRDLPLIVCGGMQDKT